MSMRYELPDGKGIMLIKERPPNGKVGLRVPKPIIPKPR